MISQPSDKKAVYENLASPIAHSKIFHFKKFLLLNFSLGQTGLPFGSPGIQNGMSEETHVWLRERCFSTELDQNVYFLAFARKNFKGGGGGGWGDKRSLFFKPIGYDLN